MRIFALLLGVAVLALAGCSKGKTGMSSSFPAPAATSMSAGSFITSPGTYESTGNPGLPGQTIDYRLSVSARGKDLELSFNYEGKVSRRDLDLTGKAEQKSSVSNAGPDWFCFVEKPGTYWIFDGRDNLKLEGLGPQGSPSKNIIQGTYVNRDNPKIPEALLARLPEKLSHRLSPPSGKLPSF